MFLGQRWQIHPCIHAVRGPLLYADFGHQHEYQKIVAGKHHVLLYYGCWPKFNCTSSCLLLPISIHSWSSQPMKAFCLPLSMEVMQSSWLGVDIRCVQIEHWYIVHNWCNHGSSTWMHVVCHIFQHNHAGVGRNSKLWTLFYHLVCFLKISVHAIFIFNSLSRPHIHKVEKESLCNSILACHNISGDAGCIWICMVWGK